MGTGYARLRLRGLGNRGPTREAHGRVRSERRQTPRCRSVEARSGYLELQRRGRAGVEFDTWMDYLDAGMDTVGMLIL